MKDCPPEVAPANNEELAWSYWELISEGKVDEALELLDDRGTFWFNRTRRTVPMPQMKTLIRELLESEIPNVVFELRNAFSSGNRVLLEMDGRISRADREDFHNVYCVVVTLESGKLMHVREHGDTRYGEEQGAKTARIKGILDEGTS